MKFANSIIILLTTLPIYFPVATAQTPPPAVKPEATPPAPALPKPKYLTGSALERQLALPVDGSWVRIPLRQVLARISDVHKICIVLDRRVDPEQFVEYTANSEPLELLLKKLASAKKLGVSIGESVIYLGPPDTAAKLNTLALWQTERLATIPAPLRKPWTTSQAWSWPEATAVDKLLAQITTAAGVTPTNPRELPHDLWAEKSWPPLTTIQRSTLFLAQFGLTWEWSADGRSITLIPIPAELEKILVSRQYTFADPAQLRQKLEKLGVKREMEIAGKKITLRGTAEEHQLLQNLLANKPAKVTSVAEGQKRYTLKLELPLATAIETLLPRLELTAKLDKTALRQAGINLDKPVKLAVKEATLDELLAALVAESGLAYKIDGQTVEFLPAKPAAAEAE
ncbi:MAG: hypothetical protein SFX18_05985 [Pirellulales bacterium]|nr:hypothetical protein [Pirellulales bacterium]